jgi:hypothetical protein
MILRTVIFLFVILFGMLPDKLHELESFGFGPAAKEGEASCLFCPYTTERHGNAIRHAKTHGELSPVIRSLPVNACSS